MNQINTTTDFEYLINFYYNTLKKNYIKEVDKAHNKEYASIYFQKVLFTENSFIPQNSILFDELKFVYNHYYSLDNKSAFENTIDMIDKIRTIAINQKQNAVSFLNEKMRDSSLPNLYFEALKKEDISIKELISLEQKVINSTNENLIGSLAIYIAGQRLYKEYNIPIIKEEKVKPKHHFTQKQQLLALFFLIESFDIPLRKNTDLTKIAALYHLILGVSFIDYDKLKNTNIYKSLRIAPQVVNSDKYLLKNLLVIKPYFEKVNLTTALELINKQIRICNNSLNER